MTNYYVFKNATRKQMARLLADIIDSAMDAKMKPDEILIVSAIIYDFLGQEAKL